MKNLSKVLIALGVLMLVGAASLEVKSNAIENNTILLNTVNTINLREPVDGYSMNYLKNEIVRLDKIRGNKDYPIYLVLNSPGGSVYDGESFIQFVKQYKNIQTITIFAASMAAGIAQAVPGERLITENGVLMFHRASGQFSGQFEDGELESQLNLWKTIVRTMEQRNADRMGMTLQDYKSKVINELWLYGKDAVTQKGADKVVGIKCSDDLINSEEISIVMIMGIIPAEAVFSACPLFTEPKRLIEVKEE